MFGVLVIALAYTQCSRSVQFSYPPTPHLTYRISPPDTSATHLPRAESVLTKCMKAALACSLFNFANTTSEGLVDNTLTTFDGASGEHSLWHLIGGHPLNFRGASKHRPFYWGGTPPQIAWLPPLLQ